MILPSGGLGVELPCELVLAYRVRAFVLGGHPIIDRGRSCLEFHHQRDEPVRNTLLFEPSRIIEIQYRYITDRLAYRPQLDTARHGLAIRPDAATRERTAFLGMKVTEVDR